MAEPSGGRSTDVGLLILRIGIGAILMCHGWPELLAGSGRWAELGRAMQVFNITWAPAVWGCIGAAAAAVGGMLLVLGFLVRPLCVVLFITAVVATTTLVRAGAAFAAWSYPGLMAAALLAMVFTGAGDLDAVLLTRSLKKK